MWNQFHFFSFYKKLLYIWLLSSFFSLFVFYIMVERNDKKMNIINKLKIGENNKYFKVIIFLYVFIWWFIPYITKNEYHIFEYIGQISISLIAMCFLIIFKDTFLALEIVLLFPFIFSKMVTYYTVPIPLIISIILLLIGIIIH